MSEYTQLITVEQIHFKREDMNTTGSIKDRGLPLQIDQAINSGYKNFVISSSGNAAISAAAYCKEKALQITIFIAPDTNEGKREIIRSLGCDLNIIEKPLTESLLFAEKTNAYHLRQSIDPGATEGFKTIAYELFDQVSDLENMDIFIPVSSGTSFVGIYEGFIDLLHKNKISQLPHMHAVQTQRIHPIVEKYDSDFVRRATSIVDAIVPPLDPPRKEQVQAIIDETKGSGWVIMDSEVLNADNWLQKNKIVTSFEGSLALAGYWKAIKKGREIKTPIIVLTGKKY